MAYSGSNWTNINNDFTVPVNGTTLDPTGATAWWNDISGGFNAVVLRNGASPFTGPQLFTDGTATTAAIAFNSESNTGIYRPATGQLGIAIQGASVAYFSSTGLTATAGISTAGFNLTSGQLNLNGSAGTAGQILMSGGASALPSWSNNLPALVQNEGSLGSGTTTIDWSAGDIIEITLTGSALTLAFSNTPAAGFSQTITIIFTQDATGDRTLPTFSATIRWDNGATPVLTTTANKTDMIQIMAVNNGGVTTFYGSQIYGNG